jgi:DeoR family transcriptional regulator of aga operon
VSADAPLPADLRREHVLSLIAEKQFVRVSDLSAAFRISEVTVRHDLDALARDGRIRRVHGGAVPREPAQEYPYEERQTEAVGAKIAIGRLAAGLVGPGESLILDVGTTTTAAAGALVQRGDLTDITAFTNGLHVALQLERAGDRFTTVVTGGTLRRLQHSLVGPMSTDLISRIRVDTAFMGCTGVDDEAGFTNVNLAEAEVKRAMLRAARRRVFLADGLKLGRIDLAQICRVEGADLLITSSTAEPSIVAGLRDRGLEVLIANEADHSDASERRVDGAGNG